MAHQKEFRDGRARSSEQQGGFFLGYLGKVCSKATAPAKTNTLPPAEQEKKKIFTEDRLFLQQD